jgi:hypothetical protein
MNAYDEYDEKLLLVRVKRILTKMQMLSEAPTNADLSGRVVSRAPPWARSG